jgi:c-di-GMP-binding flagellar brake protein YcgR
LSDITIKSLVEVQEWPTLPGLIPGTRIVITLPPSRSGGEGTPLTSIFEGFDDDGLMIVASPILNGSIFNLPIGGIYPVTYVANGNVYHISCHAKQHLSEDNLHFILLERVSEAKKIERRDAFRLSVSLPCVFSRYVDGMWSETIYAAKTLDISAGGAKILLRTPLDAGEEIKFGVTLGDVGHINFPCKVVWAEPLLRAISGTIKAGLSFHPLSRIDASVIIKYIYDEQFKRRRAARGASL